MTDKAEDVKVLRRWPGSVEILLEDFEWMEAIIAAQAAEIERLTACVAEYIVQIDEIASQTPEIELRDYMAAAALPGLVAVYAGNPTLVATEAYIQADAMLKRKQQP